MSKIIEAKARITAEDATGGVFDKIAKKIDGLAKTGKTVKAVDQLSKSFERARSQMDLLDRYTSSRGMFDMAQKKLRTAQAALDTHKAAMASMASPNVAAAEAEQRRLTKAVDLASKAYVQQKTAVLANRSAVDKAGIPVKDAVAHQSRLRDALEKTNVAIDRQVDLHKRVTARRETMRSTLPAAAAVAGAIGIHSGGQVVKKTIAAGAHYRHEETALENVGRTPEEMKQIDAASRRVTKAVPTATYTENLKVLNETTGAFGSLEHAIENLEFMQKSNAVLHAAAGNKVQDGPGEMGNKLARFFEMRGTAGDHHLFQKEAEQMVRAMVFTGGNFNPSEALNFAQQAKGALQNYDMSFLGGVAPSLVTEMGGDRAGTGANAWRNTLMGKVRDQKQTAEWVKLGLLDPKLVAGGKGGAPQSWRAGAVKNTDQALKNPLEWTEKTLIPALQKNGTNVDDPLDLSKALGTMFRNQNANQFAEQITQSRARTRLHKDRDLMDKVKPVDEAYQNNLKTDPTQSLIAITSSLENLAAAASSPAMKTAASLMSSLATGIASLAEAAKDHPAAALAGAGGTAAAAVGGAGLLANKLLNGFGLSTSAVALDTSAGLLSKAALELSGGALLGGAKGGVAGKAAMAAGGLGASGLIGPIGLLGAGVGAYYAGLRYAPAMGGTTPGSRTRAGTIGGPLPAKAGPDYEDLLPPATSSRAGRAPSIWDAPKGSTRNYLDHYANSTRGGSSPFSLEGVTAQLTGSADVSGKAEVTVRFEAGSSLIALEESVKSTVATLKGQLRAGNGPGSTGRSSPDAGAPNLGYGGSH